MDDLFHKQINRLKHHHFLILYWVTMAESKNVRYNITNAFDDLKSHNITRTKQNAVAYVESLSTLCLVNLIEERNRKNLYLTNYGGKAMEIMVKKKSYTVKPSFFLENIS